MKFNGVNIDMVKFNGVEQDKIKLNGNVVWQKENEDVLLYKFGVLSDVHIQNGTDPTASVPDFANALNYLESQGCRMTCISGDLTQIGSDAEFATYVETRDANRGDMPVYEITGNHEASSNRTYKSTIDTSDCIAYNIYRLVGKHFCYFIENGKYTYWNIDNEHHSTAIAQNVTITDASIVLPDTDVFLFVGVLGDANNGIFFEDLFQWLYNVLEAKKDKRVFLFEHCRAERAAGYSGGLMTEDLYAPYVSGNPTGGYKKPLWGQADNGGNTGLIFRTMEKLLAHYTNCIWFHGHTHMVAETELAEQVVNRPIANVDKYFGNEYKLTDFNSSANNTKWTWSIHVPSCAYPRVPNEDGTGFVAIDGRSQGLIVEVYKTHINLKYVDFAQVEDDVITYGNVILDDIHHDLDTTLDEIDAFVPPTMVIGGVIKSLIIL